jgi:parvulin-like peptidyl-prolyl isomerase
MLTQNWLIKKTQLLRVSFFALSFFFLTSCDFFSNQLLGQIVVSVGNYKLTTQDVSKSLANRLKNLDALSAKDPKVLSQFKEKIVADFIVESFLLLWFEEKKMTLTSQELDAEMKRLISGYPDDASFREALSEEGITYLQWKAKVEVGLKRKKIFEMLNSQMPPPTDSELESYFQANKLRFMMKDAVLVSHIVVADENQAEIVQKMAKKEKFTDLIKKFSMASDVAFGGTYGWIERESMPDDFDRIYKTRIGEIIGPYKLSDGYHIFKIDQKRAARPRVFAEVKDQVRSEVLALRETARFSAWLDEQIKRYKVYKNVVVLDAIYVETR